MQSRFNDAGRANVPQPAPSAKEKLDGQWS